MVQEKEMTTLNPSVAADGEQSLTNHNNSIADDAPSVNEDYVKLEDDEQYDFEAEQREMWKTMDPNYLKTVSMPELYDTVYPSRQPVIDGLLYPGTYILAGAPKLGKSFLMAQLAYHVSAGLPLWGYNVHNAYFTSIEGNPISLVNGEPYLGITDETREQSATTVVSANGVSSRNWMSGIPDERKLNEINIPGTHDSAMADVMKNFRFNFKLKNNAKMFTSYADNAITQYRHINQQLDEGFRIFDLRLNNMYEDTTSVLGMFDYVADHEDDGKNLWLVHGKTEDGGTVWAKGPDGNLVSLNKVLGWVKSFLEKHPSEVVLLNVSAETKWSEEVKPTEKRLVKIMRAFSREINPSTGKPYLWTVDGDISKNATDYPTLGEVRGQVLLKGGGTGKNGLGNAICGSAGGKYVSRKVAGDYEYGDHSKVTMLTNFFNAYGNTPLPRNVHEHLNLVFDCGTNCAPKGWQGIPSSTPLENANYVNDRVFSEGGVVDRNGYYIGWFTMDGGTAKEASVIWKTNFFDMDYVTVTVDGGLSEQDLASGAFIPAEVAALRAINIPEEGAEASGNTEGTYTYRVLRGKEITVPESYYSYDAEAVEREGEPEAEDTFSEDEFVEEEVPVEEPV